jgi:hypothetical protein
VPSLRWNWDVYYAAARAQWAGRIEATGADDAIEAAAVTFDADVRKLIVVRRREIAWQRLREIDSSTCPVE